MESHSRYLASQRIKATGLKGKKIISEAKRWRILSIITKQYIPDQQKEIFLYVLRERLKQLLLLGFNNTLDF